MGSYIYLLLLITSLEVLVAQTGDVVPLKILVVEGDGALNNTKARLGRSPVVEVRNEQGRPVEGATVEFTLPSVGAGGSFLDGGRDFRTTTDARGRSAMGPFKPTAVEGRFTIRVTAAQQNRKGVALITQTNTLAGGSTLVKRSRGVKKTLILVGLSAGAGVAGLLAMGRGGGSATPAAGGVTTISLGGVTVGGPR
jgi:hypothetical protein